MLKKMLNKLRDLHSNQLKNCCKVFCFVFDSNPMEKACDASWLGEPFKIAGCILFMCS